MSTETPPRRGLQRETVNLTPRSADALELAQQLSRDNKTDTINRAIQVLAYLLHVKDQGGSIFAEEKVEHGSVTRQLLEFL